jgi:hypothetical protein
MADAGRQGNDTRPAELRHFEAVAGLIPATPTGEPDTLEDIFSCSIWGGHRRPMPSPNHVWSESRILDGSAI